MADAHIKFGQNGRDRCRVAPLRQRPGMRFGTDFLSAAVVSVTPLLLGDASKQGVGGQPIRPLPLIPHQYLTL
jgi:hypothetical protein